MQCIQGSDTETPVQREGLLIECWQMEWNENTSVYPISCLNTLWEPNNHKSTEPLMFPSWVRDKYKVQETSRKYHIFKMSEQLTQNILP